MHKLFRYHYLRVISKNAYQHLPSYLPRYLFIDLHLRWDDSIDIDRADTATFVKTLNQNTTLKSLTIEHCSHGAHSTCISDQIVEGLQSNTSITSLSLDQVGDSSLAKLMQTNTTLKRLSIMSKQSAAWLGQNTTLTAISLYEINEVANLLKNNSSGLKRLQDFTITHDYMELYEVLKSNTTIIQLGLSISSNDNVLTGLAELLKHNKTLAGGLHIFLNKDIDYSNSCAELKKILEKNYIFHSLIIKDAPDSKPAYFIDVYKLLDKNKELFESAMIYLLEDKERFHSKKKALGNIAIIKYLKSIDCANELLGHIKIRVMQLQDTASALATKLTGEYMALYGNEHQVNLCLTPKYFHQNFFEVLALSKELKPAKELAEKEAHISHLPKEIIDHIVSYISLQDMRSMLGDLQPDEIAHIWDGVFLDSVEI